ncbi:LLM class flavin-dependent oxidoreductase [Tsukamurella spumae]|uniref:LLM class flavin-dependent oxidoreductase n=1 Tax=Tsukamurella spumae TaxID=44753 RepID=A0A846X6C5_9ACTN|nr:LLM class flavin-dependent oxidoreductase [Tsukamurella spumae]NKY19762.1 LLM class flavin-dependent oxidoreductase [Tsukamurella spumae]
MPDYGHEPIFGSFATPVNEPTFAAVESAIAAENAGFDLVSIQDHPYQPRFHDTWTLMSYIAARTSRISITANVFNLPLRPPAMLAKSVATLDQLSGGRIEVGIGAGGFWDPIVAMGGPRRTPGESLVGLSEAIDIMHEMWDTSKPGGVHYRGEIYTVDGAKRGPAPAHEVGIWVGGYKPRMLGLIGGKADGWLPSLSRLEGGLEDVARMNAVIDEAALAAGREPADIRRLFNHSGRPGSPREGRLTGPSEAWVDDLVELAIDYGMSGFIIGGDDRYTLDVIGAEVIPAAREAIRRARA